MNRGKRATVRINAFGRRDFERRVESLSGRCRIVLAAPDDASATS